MKSKFIIIIIILSLLGGFFVFIINNYYSFNYLYNIILNRGLQINPRAKINPEKQYTIDIWYYPLFRAAGKNLSMEELLIKIRDDIYNQYPNFELNFRKLSFLDGPKTLIDSVQEGNPPDIYFNINDDIFLNDRYQIPVEWYITEEEKRGFYTVNWHKINQKNHLWGFPFLIEKQVWVANYDLNDGLDPGKQLFNHLQNSNLEGLEGKKLFLNIYDTTLIRQLLALMGMKNIQITENTINEKTRKYFKNMYIILDKLRGSSIITSSVKSNIIKELIKGKNIIAGPVNPWLKLYLHEKKINKAEISVAKAIKIYSINVFTQKDYKGDDHIKAVMEIARYISKNYSFEVAKILKLEPGYSVSTDFTEDRKILFQLTPSEQQYWQEVIIPAWIDFWEKELTVEEVMDRL